jgi:3',5'-cyclic AMP phosphodiesterase CpdA
VSGELLAISDLHVEHAENRKAVEAIRPRSDQDWLLLAGDVANDPGRLRWALDLLVSRFEKVVWVPGNHELHAYPADPVELRGERRYLHLVDLCRELGVITPEDPYPIWDGSFGPVRIVPMFLLYDYTFSSNIAPTRQEALRRAYEAGVVCDDEFLLHPDPYPSRGAWCEARVEQTLRRLEDIEQPLPSVLVNHFPLRIEATRGLMRPEFAQWCGTVRTADWHRRFRAAAVVYGHLHINRTMWHDGVPFEEVSLGNPRDRIPAGGSCQPRCVLPR